MAASHVNIGSLAYPEKGSFKIGPFGSSLKKEEIVDSGVPVVADIVFIDGTFEWRIHEDDIVFSLLCERLGKRVLIEVLR